MSTGRRIPSRTVVVDPGRDLTRRRHVDLLRLAGGTCR
ncbi:putative leader peptide [Pseudonocardia tropica]|uniref:Leader peptide n=1 Tax=Pseudonocardia tropica TaxID=681289 RepID=A0ABV1JUI5_9PSEU